jgi:hypothetical protein
MGILSIFPESFATVETWITRVFVCRERALVHWTIAHGLILAVLGHRHHRAMGGVAYL